MSESKIAPVNVRIKQFQSIEDVEVEVRGFTCITGPTNIGKSAIIRALASSALNKPVGGLVRSGAKFCSVDVSGPGWSYLWEKGGGVNRYTIDGKVYDKVGQAQLPEVEKLGFTSVEVGKSDLHPWLADQFSPVFLLDESGASVTDFISKVSRLSVLQDAIVLSSRGKKREADAAKDCAERAAAAREKLSRVAAVDGLMRLREDLVAQARSVREYESLILAAEAHVARTASLAAKIGALSKVSSVRAPHALGPAPLAELSSVHSYWRRLEGAARRVIGLKALPGVRVPDAPESELDGLRSAVRFSRIPALAAAVKKLGKLGKLAVPDQPWPEDHVAKLRKAEASAASIERLRGSVGAIDREVRLPDAPPDALSEMRGAAGMERRRRAHAAEVESLEAKVAALESRIKDAEARVAAIPKCLTCGRVNKHAHA